MKHIKPNTMKSYSFMPFLCFKLKTDNKIENGDPTIFLSFKMICVSDSTKHSKF